MECPGHQSNNSNYDINFLTGINWLLTSDYQQAIDAFQIAIVNTEASDAQYPVYQSYAALSSVLLHQLGGLHQCFHASDISSHCHPEVQLNLACAGLIAHNRKVGIQAFDNIDKESLSSETSAEIQSFFDMAGKREQGENGSLKRDRLINRTLGRMLRKKQVESKDIETFIRDTAQKRYYTVILKLQNLIKRGNYGKH